MCWYLREDWVLLREVVELFDLEMRKEWRLESIFLTMIGVSDAAMFIAKPPLVSFVHCGELSLSSDSSGMGCPRSSLSTLWSTLCSLEFLIRLMLASSIDCL